MNVDKLHNQYSFQLETIYNHGQHRNYFAKTCANNGVHSQAIVEKTPFPVFRKQSVHNISKNLPLQQENKEESKKALHRTRGNSQMSKLTSTKM